jgi:hypothetical protein
VQDEPTAEDAHWLAAVSAGKVVRNGTSLSGRLEGGERRGKIIRNGASLNGCKLNGHGGMTVVSIEVPGGSRHAK